MWPYLQKKKKFMSIVAAAAVVVWALINDDYDGDGDDKIKKNNFVHPFFSCSVPKYYLYNIINCFIYYCIYIDWYNNHIIIYKWYERFVV